MGNLLQHLKTTFQEGFSLETFGLYYEISEVRSKIEEKKPRKNCAKIVIVAPIMVVLYVITYMMERRYYSGTYISIITVLFGIQIIEQLLITIFLIILTEVNRDRKYNTNRICKWVDQVYWITWCVFMMLHLMMLLEKGQGMYLYILVLILFCYVPILSFKCFFLIWVLFMVGYIVYYTYGFWSLRESYVTAICCYSILISGYISHRLHLNRWMLQIYLYLATFEDELTGLLNRRGGNHLLNTWEKTKICTIGVLMLDIDDFKKYNDCFGHDEGDVCLKKIALIIQRYADNANGIAIRHGGEEMVLLVPKIGRNDFYRMASQICEDVYGLKLRSGDGAAYPYVSVSVGVDWMNLCEDRSKQLHYEYWIDSVDKALYDSKEKGKNQVTYVR